MRKKGPKREEAMVGYEGQGNMKHLIKDGDNTIQCAWEMQKHGKRLQRGQSAAYMNDEELEKEIDDFIEYCIANKQVPSQVGLSLWLGVSIETITAWRTDSISQHHIATKNVIELFHKIIEQKVLDGELNPVLYMFYGKNWFGLSDKTEIVHKSQTTQVIDISEQQRILRSTPGVVIDATWSEKPVEAPRALENRSEDLDTVDLGSLLRGYGNGSQSVSENLATENLAEDLEDLD